MKDLVGENRETKLGSVYVVVVGRGGGGGSRGKIAVS